jgi:GxxExxY protein
MPDFMRTFQTEDDYNAVTSEIIGAAIDVHRNIGAGLLEFLYEYAMIIEIQRRGLLAQQQVRVPFIYKGVKTDKEFVVDIVVKQEIVVELKSVETLNGLHGIQVQTYLRLLNKPLGLLFNFNVHKIMPDGFRRIANDFFNN